MRLSKRSTCAIAGQSSPIDYQSVAKTSKRKYNYGEVITMFEIDKQKFGSFVSELRKEKGLTQKEVAERLFISPKAISKWETGVSQS